MMLSNLCLAQAQNLYYKRAKEINRDAEHLSKLCAQTALFFQKAFEANQMNAHLRTFNESKFGNQLGFQAKFYTALAYKLQAEALQQEVMSTNYGAGKLVTLLKITVGKLNEAKRFIESIGEQEGFEKVCRDVIASRDEAIRMNNIRYKENEAVPSQI